MRSDRSPFCFSGLDQSPWSIVTHARVSYTDDAFQFSWAPRQPFSEDPSLPTVVPIQKTTYHVNEAVHMMVSLQQTQ